MRAKLFCALVVISACALGASSSPQPVPQPATAQSHALEEIAKSAKLYSDEKKNPANEPDSENILREIRTVEAQERATSYARVTLILSWIQLALSTITIAGLYYTIKYTRHTAQETTRAVNSAIDTAKIQLRAYVTLDEISISSMKPFTISFFFKNSGQTPALKLATQTAMALMHPHQLQFFPLTIPEFDTDGHSLGGGSRSPLHSTIFSITPDIETELTTNRRIIAISVAFKYEDIYGNAHDFRDDFHTYGHPDRGITIRRAPFPEKLAQKIWDQLNQGEI